MKEPFAPEKSDENIFWFRMAFHDEQCLGFVRSRGRFDLVLILTLLLLLVLWEVAFAGWILPMTLKSWHETHKDFWTVPTGSMMVIVPLFFIFWLCRQIPMEAMTGFQVLFNEKATVINYFGFFKKRIPALPSWVEIYSTPSRQNCYDGRSFLRFEKHRTKIPFVCTNGWFDYSSGAERCAAEAMTKIQDTLHLKIKLPDENIATSKDRFSALIGILFFAGFSTASLFVAFSHVKLDGGIPFIPEILNQVLGKILFGIVGVLTAGGAFFFFWQVIKPNKRK